MKRLEVPVSLGTTREAVVGGPLDIDSLQNRLELG